MLTNPHPPRSRTRPANGALAEALFTLSETEPPGERRVALLRAGYAAFDTATGARRAALEKAPPWLRPLIEQLAACHGEDALAAAVERLAAGVPPRRRGTRAGYLSRAAVAEALRNGPPEIHPQRLRGACHWHTRDSDGKASLEAMARACQRRGFAWSMVADHSRGLEVASGLDREGLRLQRGRRHASRRRNRRTLSRSAPAWRSRAGSSRIATSASSYRECGSRSSGRRTRRRRG